MIKDIDDWILRCLLISLIILILSVPFVCYWEYQMRQQPPEPETSREVITIIQQCNRCNNFKVHWNVNERIHKP